MQSLWNHRWILGSELGDTASMSELERWVRHVAEHTTPQQGVWWDGSDEAQLALERGAVDQTTDDPITAAVSSDLILLSGPVFSIQDWMEKLAPHLNPHQLVTDVGSV